ncbi:hypothetical protein K8R42_03110 [bacterium]|nr:hypothetical protein [bacterium]
MSDLKKLIFLTVIVFVAAISLNILMHTIDIKDDMSQINALTALWLTVVAWTAAATVIIWGVITLLARFSVAQPPIEYNSPMEQIMAYRFFIINSLLCFIVGSINIYYLCG